MIPYPWRIHWMVVLILSALTGGVFGAVCLVLQGNWVRTIRGRSPAFFLAIANCVFTMIVATLAFAQLATETTFALPDYWELLELILWTASVYALRSELRSEPIGLQLDRFMPMLFGPVYFQYHLMEYRTGRAKVGSAGQPLGL